MNCAIHDFIFDDVHQVKCFLWIIDEGNLKQILITIVNIITKIKLEETSLELYGGKEKIFLSYVKYTMISKKEVFIAIIK